MYDTLLLAVSGAVGTVSRYALSSWTNRLLGGAFPYGTLLVNVLGSLALGFAVQMGLSGEFLTRTARLAITVGLLGGFTTFSTFSYETIRYLADGHWRFALANVVSNLALGLGAAWIGFLVGRWATGTN